MNKAKGESDTVNRRTDNKIVKRKNTNKQWSTKHYTEHYK